MYRKYVVCETFEGTGDFQAEKQQAGVGAGGGWGSEILAFKPITYFEEEGSILF